jgi:hypothetical protein
MKIFKDHCGEGDEGEVVGMRFIDLYFEENTKTICCVMY